MPKDNQFSEDAKVMSVWRSLYAMRLTKKENVLTLCALRFAHGRKREVTMDRKNFIGLKKGSPLFAQGYSLSGLGS